MYITRIRLKNYRSFKDATLSFSKDITVIVGPNASGKTNIVESLFLLSTGKSFHARIEEEMVNYDEEIARVKAVIAEADEDKSETKLEVLLTRGLITIGESPEKVE